MGDFGNVIFYSSDLGRDMSVRDFFKQLMITLFVEGEGFSGKRPFGNSGWTHDLEKTAVENKFVQGVIGSDGYVENIHSEEFDDLIFNTIKNF